MGKQGKRIEIPCAFGTLVAEVVGDPGIYDEIGIDLVRPDGATMQLVTAGTGPNAKGEGHDLHVYVWDGSDESAAITVHPDMETDFWW
jgi:hypothetical protein